MPHVLDVRCPSCRGCARFEFAEVVRIKLLQDVPFFQGSAQFEYAFFLSNWAGQNWHGAIYFPGLHGSATTTIHGLPEGYEAAAWEHSKYLYRAHGLDLGSVTCSACSYRGKHELNWPADAFFQVDFRGQVLWAFHRESATELKAFVESTDRDRSKFRWERFLRHVPSSFLTAKVRPALVRRLEKMLQG